MENSLWELVFHAKSSATDSTRRELCTFHNEPISFREIFFAEISEREIWGKERVRGT